MELISFRGPELVLNPDDEISFVDLLLLFNTFDDLLLDVDGKFLSKLFYFLNNKVLNKVLVK